MAAAPKKGVGILALLGGGGGDEDSAAPDDKTMAAKDLMRAIKSGDASGVASAFQDMYNACAMKHGGDEGDEDEELDLEEE